MPAFLVPHKSGAHRVTAIALYRALLTKCRSAPPSLDRSALEAVVKKSFAKNRHVTSKYVLQGAFAGGYEALDHLTASITGDNTSVSHLNSLLYRLPSSLKTTTPPPKPPPPPPTKPAAVVGSTLSLRPRPAFSLPSRRRIPVLVNANKIPILRFTKPQPAILSQYVRSRLVLRQKRLDLKLKLETDMEIAKAEDEWDRILFARGIKEESGNEVDEFGRRQKRTTWTAAIYEALGQTYKAIEDEGVKNKEMAKRMVGIIDREKELAEVERKERQRVKNEERKKRKAERDGIVDKSEVVTSAKSKDH
ncbi:hypothetical protein D6C99_01780 [Aureobasidium pullulans]|nr:hypothetical protein D6C99_01780 [Aureobasidium pullulans]